MNTETLVEKLQSEKRKYRELIDAIDVLISTYEKNDGTTDGTTDANTRGTTVVIPATFEGALTWKEKVLFGLNQCANKKGFVSDIINVLKTYDSTISKDNTPAFNQITGQASRLAKKRIIGYRAVGSKNQYFIK
ncbi:MAG TPA: hypothetical protein PK809_14995 [Bacteroidia bacterium]|nr:hypothetical protein [Bacteroidia bacterium]